MPPPPPPGPPPGPPPPPEMSPEAQWRRETVQENLRILEERARAAVTPPTDPSSVTAASAAMSPYFTPGTTQVDNPIKAMVSTTAWQRSQAWVSRLHAMVGAGLELYEPASLGGFLAVQWTPAVLLERLQTLVTTYGLQKSSR